MRIIGLQTCPTSTRQPRIAWKCASTIATCLLNFCCLFLFVLWLLLILTILASYLQIA